MRAQIFGMKVRWAQSLLGGLACILALVPAWSARAESMYALTTGQQLISFDSSNPSQLFSAYFVQGLQANERLLEIDYRASTGQLVGLGSFGNLYNINPVNGAATLVNSSPITTVLSGTSFGMDFDNATDTVRIVSNLGQNLTVSPATGAVLGSANLAYGSSDILAGRIPNVQAVAFDASSQLYLLDSAHNTLARESSSVNGQLQTQGIVALPALRRFSGFDISQGTGIGYASAEGIQNGLFQINLQNGTSTFLGTIGGYSDDLLVYGLTVIPEPSTWVIFGVGLLMAGVLTFRSKANKHAATRSV